MRVRVKHSARTDEDEAMPARALTPQIRSLPPRDSPAKVSLPRRWRHDERSHCRSCPHRVRLAASLHPPPFPPPLDLRSNPLAASCCRRLLLCCCRSSSSFCCGCCCGSPSAPPPVVDWRRVKGLVLSLACTIIAAPSRTLNTTTSTPPHRKMPRAAVPLVVVMA